MFQNVKKTPGERVGREFHNVTKFCFSLPLSLTFQSDDEDCQYPQWYHQSCFFKTRLPQTEAAFDGFALLRYTDQLTIRDELG